MRAGAVLRVLAGAALRLGHVDAAGRGAVASLELVGDHFVVLKLGAMALDAKRSEITLDQLTRQMAGGDELQTLAHELERGDGATPAGGIDVAGTDTPTKRAGA